MTRVVGGEGVLARLVFGMNMAFSGFGMVRRDAVLARLALVPMGVHLLLFGGLVGAVVGAHAEVVNALVPASGFFAHEAWRTVASVLVTATGVVTSLVLTVLLGSVVCDPFYDLLSERTEELAVGRHVAPPFTWQRAFAGMFRELKATVLQLFVYALVAVPLFVLSLTPLAFVAGPLNVAWTWLFLAYEFMSRSLIRHAVRPSRRFQPIVDNRAACLAFGAGAWLLSFVPFSAPLLVVGATKLYLGLVAAGRAPSVFSETERARLGP